jgi:integrative and conjugative element protein (TIGR02256 family)
MGRVRFQHNSLPYQVAFEHRAWNWIQKRIQVLPWSHESGGQLFGKIDGWNVVVSEATGPNKKDRHSRVSFVFDVPSANREIVDRFSRGLHYLGDWHTHPETVPQPSLQDRQNAGRVFNAANGRPFFIMVIAGSSKTYVGLYNAKHIVRLDQIVRPRSRWL